MSENLFSSLHNPLSSVSQLRGHACLGVRSRKIWLQIVYYSFMRRYPSSYIEFTGLALPDEGTVDPPSPPLAPPLTYTCTDFRRRNGLENVSIRTLRRGAFFTRRRKFLSTWIYCWEKSTVNCKQQFQYRRDIFLSEKLSNSFVHRAKHSNERQS